MREITEHDFTEVAQTAIEIGRERRKKMKKLRTALQKKDEKTALNLAHEIVGLNRQKTESAA